MEQTFNNRKDFLRLKQMSIRYISCISIFALTLLFTPNFEISSFPIFLLSSLCIITLDYLMATISSIHDLPLGRGIVGFVAAAVIIYVTSYIVAGYSINITSSLIAASIYGLIDSLIPNN